MNKDKEKCKTTIYSRITGYFQPLMRWNKGKVEEFKDRKRFKIGGNYVEHRTTGDGDQDKDTNE